MSTDLPFDPEFDFLDEAGGEDPDRYSPTLKSFHQRLWSKSLPNGEAFEVTTLASDHYLYHSSNLGEFCLSSDSGIPTWKYWQRPAIAEVVGQIPTEVEELYRLAYTMGGMIAFPAGRVEGQHTINQARGVSWAIGDRLDLTLECIRRHYLGDLEPSPLSKVLERYGAFFGLFGSFEGYVEFFLLQDLCNEDWSVRLFRPHSGFDSSPPCRPASRSTGSTVMTRLGSCALATSEWSTGWRRTVDVALARCRLSGAAVGLLGVEEALLLVLGRAHPGGVHDRPAVAAQHRDDGLVVVDHGDDASRGARSARAPGA